MVVRIPDPKRVAIGFHVILKSVLTMYYKRRQGSGFRNALLHTNSQTCSRKKTIVLSHRLYSLDRVQFHFFLLPDKPWGSAISRCLRGLPKLVYRDKQIQRLNSCNPNTLKESNVHFMKWICLIYCTIPVTYQTTITVCNFYCFWLYHFDRNFSLKSWISLTLEIPKLSA